MPNYLPSDTYAAALKMPHPIEKNLWHPDEFSFDGLRATLTTLQKDVSFTNVNVMQHLLQNNTSSGLQTAALTFPVCFSPSHAVEVAKLVREVGNMPAAFVFESTSPTYDFYSEATARAMSEIANMDFDLGISLGIQPGRSVDDTIEMLQHQLGLETTQMQKAAHANPKIVTYQATGVDAKVVREVAQRMPLPIGIASPYADEFQNKARVAMITTSNGLYKNGHPAHGFMKDKKPYGIIQLIPEWFSEKPLWPSSRLNELPEVKANYGRFQAEYLDRVKAPTLGTAGTYAHVSHYDKKLATHSWHVMTLSGK